MELTIPGQRTWMLKSVVEEDKICLELAEKSVSDCFLYVSGADPTLLCPLKSKKTELL